MNPNTRIIYILEIDISATLKKKENKTQNGLQLRGQNK